MTASRKTNLSGRVALVTGSAIRVGSAIVRALHAAGATVIIHYRHSNEDALQLKDELKNVRPDSAVTVQGDLNETDKMGDLVRRIIERFDRLDILVNNASSFYPTPVGEITEEAWTDLVGSNLKAPVFLSQAAAPHLKATHGLIINIVDIYAASPLADHPVYCAAKAGLVMLTKSLARDLAPEVRVNGIAPGPILWPDDQTEAEKKNIIAGTALKRVGSPEDIADCVTWLAGAEFVTGQIIAVDGGRSIGWS